MKTSSFFKKCLPFVGLIWMLGGLGMALASGPRLWVGWNSGHWPSVNGKIIQSQVLPVKNASGQAAFYKAVVRYEYSPPSSDRYPYAFEGTRLSFRGFADPADDSYTLKQAQALTRKYPVGSSVAVYYSPQDKQTSILQPGTSFGTWGGIIAGMVLVILGAGLFFLSSRMKPSATD